MKEFRHPHPNVVLLAVTLLLVVGGCTVTSPPAPAPGSQPAGVTEFPQAQQMEIFVQQYDKEVRCRAGNHSKGSPILCVDNFSTRPHPYSADVWDTEGVAGIDMRTPVIVHWFTKRTANLQIRFKDPACAEEPVCDGKGNCRVQLKPLHAGTARRCEYVVSIDGVEKERSPELAVNPCCW